MKKISVSMTMMLLLNGFIFSQVAVNTDGTAPDPSAGLDVKFSDKGVLLPRMPAEQRDAISSPAEGLMVFCTDCGSKGSLSIYSNGEWITFAPCSIPTPTTGINIVTPGQIDWNWNAVTGATGYKWNSTNNYGTAIDMGTSLVKSETGIICNTVYSRYVWAYNTCSFSAPAILSETTLATAPATPSTGTHIPAKTQIIWNWNTVSDVIGYRWNTTNDFASATEMGLVTTKTDTALTCETLYTRYVWAYNGCGLSSPVTLSQSTISCFTCGDSVIFNHVAGAVAPVNKTVTYGTVTNIPGETSKCWISSNLGADHQATDVNDGTEASAGWSWQFNRKQGFKHEGTTRIPGTTWITSISESTDWTAGNDPCALELENGWRIPTSTEWTNVDATGGWTDWNGPWNSLLKLHAAGYLYYTNGASNYRSTAGFYWSSTQDDADMAWGLIFGTGQSDVSSNHKEYGFSLRCIKE